MKTKRGPKPEILRMPMNPADAFARLFAAPRLTRKQDEEQQRKRRKALRRAKRKPRP